MKKFTLLLSALVLAASSGSVMADNANWSTQKARTVDANRNSDAGIGNGGERRIFSGNWVPTYYGEDGRRDIDPGNSRAHNQACTGGTQSETSC